MNVAFITIHVGFNFGSILQTIATSEIFKKLGHSPICVNYIPPRVMYRRYWKVAFSSPPKFVRRLLYFPFFFMSKFHYNRYLKKHCKLSKAIYDNDSFKDCCPKADVYVSGSDQIWNYKHNEGLDKHYFFDGIEGKKVAYAASIGMTELPHVYSDYMRRQLQTYSAISVREDSATLLLRKWGVTATHVLDPTLMLNKEEWKQFSSKRLIKESYLFVYLPYNIVDKAQIYKSVRKIANEKALRVVTYSDSFICDKDADETIRFAVPGDVLSLIYYADVVVTNSFHGTAFSINLNKQFWTYMPSSFSTRIQSILEKCSLNDRLLSDVIKNSQISERIDFTYTNAIIEGERVKALEFLNKALH